jgi:hypothetical protein
MKDASRIAGITAVLVAAAIGAGFSHPDPARSINRLSDSLKVHPDDEAKRIERAVLLLDMANVEKAGEAEEDIQRLLNDPAQRAQGLHLQARQLFISGRLPEAKEKIIASLAQGGPAPERLRLLGRIELARKDSASSLKAFQQAWESGKDEGDFVSLVVLLEALGPVPLAFLKRGFKQYPGHPAAVAAIYDACATASEAAPPVDGGGAPASPELLFCLDVSRQAQDAWWPRSVDWKIKHARLLFALRRKDEGQPLLFGALNLLDARPDFLANAGPSMALLREILGLLEAAEKSP